MSLELRLHGIVIRTGTARVYALHGERSVGEVVASNVLRRSLSDDCFDDIDDLEVLTGRDLTNVWSVGNARVDERLRGWGLGVELYAFLVQLVGENIPDAVVVANACTEGTSSTSASARRVWSSRSMAELVDVSGLAATTPTGPERWTAASPILERVVILEGPLHALDASVTHPP